MRARVIFTTKRAAAKRTRERLLSGMRSHVPGQVAISRKFVVAYGANEPFFVAVHHSRMLQK